MLPEKLTRENPVNSAAVFVNFEPDMSHIDLLREICFKMTGEQVETEYQCCELIGESLSVRQRIIIICNSNGMRWNHYETLRYLHDKNDAAVILIGEESLKKEAYQNRHIMARVRKEVRCY